jgi:hypothetical protein
MFHFLRLPKRFHVLVRGSNFSIKLGVNKDELVTGFYTNRWVDAFDSEQATAMACRSVRRKLHEKGYGSIVSDLKLEIDEIEQVGFWRERWSKTQGFVFYPQEEESQRRS